MHFSFIFIVYLSTPTYVSVLYKVIFRGFINYVHFTPNVTSAIITSLIFVYKLHSQSQSLKYTRHTQKNGAVLIVNTIKPAPLFCVCPVYRTDLKNTGNDMQTEIVHKFHQAVPYYHNVTG